jgi:hypothetical protein
VPIVKQPIVLAPEPDQSQSDQKTPINETILEQALKPLKSALKSATTSRTSLVTNGSPETGGDLIAGLQLSPSKMNLHVGFSPVIINQEEEKHHLSFKVLSQELHQTTDYIEKDGPNQKYLVCTQTVKCDEAPIEKKPRPPTARPLKKFKTSGFEFRRSYVVESIANQLIDRKCDYHLWN